MITFSSGMLIVAMTAGTLAVLVAVLHGYTPLVKYVRDKWRAYEKWANENLRAIYSPMRARELAKRQGGSILAGLFLGGIVFGSWFYGIMMAAIFLALPGLWLRHQRSKRRQQLDAQLDATLQSMANTILVTQNLEDAFATIAQHFDPPISQEADIVVKQVRLGTPMDEALRELSARCQSRNVDAIVTALTVGRQTGGELPKVLETTASVLRETMRVEGVMASKTSEGKAQIVVMAIVPFFFAGVLQLFNPEWMQPLFRDPIGWAIIVFACVLEAIGLAMARKFARIDV